MKYLLISLLILIDIGCGKASQNQPIVCNDAQIKLYDQQTIEFWGDSITQGQLGGASSYNTAFAIILSNLLNTNDENHGYSGSQLTDPCEIGTIMNWNNTTNSNTTNVWLVGFNDATFSGMDPNHLALFQNNLTQGLIHLSGNGQKTFVGTTLNVPSTATIGLHSRDTVNTYVAIEVQVINQLALQGYPVYLVDTNSAYDADTMCSSDNTHPSDTGHAVIAKAFQTAILNN